MIDEAWFMFFAGLLVSGVLSWILNNIRRENFNANAPNRRMAVMTERTPRQVMEDADGARWRLWGWRLFLLLVSAGLIVVAASWFFGF